MGALLALSLVACLVVLGVPAGALSSGSPSIASDKADYAPGETVTLTGAGWAASESVHIAVEDSSSNSWSHGSDPDPVADATGGFTYQFELPTFFVSNYAVTATGATSGTATTSFTDLSIGTYDQCANDDGDGGGGDPGACDWVNGNLQPQNSTYAEDDATVQRLWLTDFAPGTSHTVRFKYGTTKGGKHAYDFLTTWDWSENWITLADRCDDITGCTTAGETVLDIPEDSNVPNAFEPSAPGDRQFVMRGGTLNSATTPAIVSGTYAGDSETVITVSFTVASSGAMCETQGQNTECSVAIWFGAHVAAQADWGAGTGAASIDGSPYHVALDAVDNASVGQRDNQMQSNTIVVNGTIVIVKDAQPNDAQDFAFTLAGGSVNESFSLDDDADGTLPSSRSFTVAPGTYTAQEVNIPAGWTLTNLVCVDPTSNTTVNLGTATASINLAAGETVTCTYTDTKQSRIVVDKVTNPSGDPQSFSFDAGGGSYADFSLTDAAAPNSQTLVAGNYSVTETVPAGWALSNTSCVSSIGDTETAGAIELDTGETVTCTFTNTRNGTIIVDKVTNPSGDAQSFSFDGGGGSYADFSLTDAAAPNSQSLVPGAYSVAETVPAGWDLTSSTCVSSIADTETPGSIELDAGETVTCTFTNTKRGKILVDKVAVGGNGTQFEFDSSYGANFFLTDAAAPNDSGLLAPGSYSVAEVNIPAGWDLTTATCDDGSSPANIGLAAGETVTCTFTNTKRGTIIVEKQTNPDGAAGSFTFTGDAAGTISDNGQITVNNLAPGTYTSVEGDPTPGFDLTGIVCDDAAGATDSTGDVGTRTATFRLDPGETVKCTFTNRQRGMVEVLKITNGQVRSDLDIKFTLYRDGPDTDPDLTATDTQLEELTTLGDADGLLQFTTKLVPGTKYTVCENPVPAGWTSLWMISFTVNGQIVTPYNPNGNDVPPSDVGIRCIDFTVDPGQTLRFEVHNDFPGGDPRTIGYWKNWNQCTGGGQAANAAKNGGAANGFYLVEDLLPQLVGDFNVTTCQQAVKVLDKSDQSGKKRANDAAYELASQLLAAKLNLAAGAETCTAVQNAVVNGQALLDSINFTGSGSYLTKASANRTQALSLATTLDNYNNGNLCP